MSYFRNFSDLLYQSPLASRTSSYDYIRTKNIFRRAKIRDDIFQAAVAFDKYKIIGEERPDHIANKIYGSSQYDWVILIANNIINLREEWPLSDSEFSNYIQTKYTQAELASAHHYETTAYFDTRGKMIVPAGKIVDSNFTVTYFDYEVQSQVVLGIPYTFDSSTTTFDSSLVRFDMQEQIQIRQGTSYTVNPVKSVSVYEYEIQRNEDKRNIYVLKPRFLQTIIDDLDEIMNYGFSSQYVDRSTKKGDNLRIVSPR
jgi:hypothetical protein